MNRVETTSKVQIYGIDDEDIPIDQETPYLILHSHWNQGSMVVLEMDGKKITVAVKDLVSAIRRCEGD